MGGQDAASVNPLALAFLAAMCFLIVRSSPRKAIMALLATAAFVPLGQQFVVAGLHLYFLRLLILAGVIRVLTRHEASGFKLARVDKLVIWCILVEFVCGLIREPSAEVFGTVYNNLGVYLLFRILMKDEADPLSDLRVLAIIGIAMGLCMAQEMFTHRNPFFVLGGVPEITVQRGDRFRCQGPFRHPILAGTFGATLIPLMVGLWQQGGRNKGLAVLGAISGFVITIASASSGPLLTFLAAIVGFGLWPLRNRMRLFRRGVTVVILGLAMVMKAPVWFIIDRIGGLIGGGGFYRSDLIDKFTSHFSQWWLIGTSYTANWATAGIVLSSNPNMIDITNHYVAQGIAGGMTAFVLFLAILVACFKIVGRAARSTEEVAFDRKLAWALGVCLACHCTAFISVAYFDQIQVFWFWLLAVIASIPEQTARLAETNESQSAESDHAGGVFDAVPEGS